MSILGIDNLESDVVLFNNYFTQSRSIYFYILAHFVNIISLCSLNVCLAKKIHVEPLSHVAPSFDFQFTWVEMFVMHGWTLYSLSCLILLVLLKEVPDLIEKYSGEKARQVWCNFGAFILMTQVFKLVIMFVKFVTSHHNCNFVEGLNAAVTTSDTPLFRLFVDCSQIVVFSTVPFPSPWVMLFNLVEILIQALRLLSCSHTMGLGHHDSLLNAVVLGMVWGFCLIMFSASHVESVSKEVLRCARQEREAIDSKRLFVNYLCAEVKDPLQLIIGPLDHIEEDFSSFPDDMCDEHKKLCAVSKAIRQNTRVIVLLANNLMLITRMEEGRLFLQSSQQVVLKDMLQEILRNMNWSEARESLRVSVVRSEILTDAPCLNVLLENVCWLARAMRSEQEAKLRHALSINPSVELEIKLLSATEATATTQPLGSGHPGSSASDEKQVFLSIALRSLIEKEIPTAASSSLLSSTSQPHAHPSPNLRAMGSDSFLTQFSSHSYPSTASTQSTDVVTASATKQSLPAASIPSNHTRMASSEYVCQVLAKAFGGTYVMTADAVTLTVACKRALHSKKSIERALDPVALAGNKDPRGGTGGAVGLDPWSPRAGVPAVVSTQSVLAFSSTSDMVSVIEPILPSLRIRALAWKGSDFDALCKQIRNLSKPGEAMLITTSPSACLDLRSKEHFVGRLVLVTAGLAYLDSDVKPCCDYLIPFPCDALEAQQFVSWMQWNSNGKMTAPPADLGIQRTRFFGVNNGFIGRAHFSRDMNTTAGSAPLGTSSPANVAKDSTLLGMRFSFREKLVLGVPVFMDDELEDEFSKWGLLEPKNNLSIMAVAVFLPVGYVLQYVMTSEVSAFKTTPVMLTFFLISLSVIGILARCQIYEYFLVPNGIKLKTYAIFLVGMNICFIVMMILTTVFQIAARADYSSNHTDSMLIIDMINTLLFHSVAPVLLCSPWPWGFIYWCINIVRCEVYFSKLVPKMGANFIVVTQILLILLCAVATTNHYYIEITCRYQYQMLRKTSYSNVFIDKCVSACQQDLKSPLKALLLGNDDLIKIIQKNILSGRNISISKRFGLIVQEVASMHKGLLILKKMAGDLELKELLAAKDPINPRGEVSPSPWSFSMLKFLWSQFSGSASVFQSRYSAPSLQSTLTVSSGDSKGEGSPSGLLQMSHTILVRDQLVAAASLFVEGDVFDITIQVDQLLSYVKVNQGLFNSLVCNGLAIANRNISRKVMSDPRQQNFLHKVAVSVQPCKEYKLNHSTGAVNLMTIEILDTGSRDMQDEDSFSHNVYRQVMAAVMPESKHLPSSGNISRGQFTCFQRFSVPFQFHPLSKPAMSLAAALKVEVESARRLNTMIAGMAASWSSHVKAESVVTGDSKTTVLNFDQSTTPRSSSVHNVKLLLITGSGDDCSSSQSLSTSSMFEMHGFVCDTIVGCDALFTGQKFQNVDCILFLETPSGGALSPETINHIRLTGYKMIVAGLFNSSAAAKRASRYLDIVLTKPVINHTMDKLLHACMVRRAAFCLRSEVHNQEKNP